MNNTLLEYFNGDELAASTWKNKYAGPNETHPNEMHYRLAKEFARIESNYAHSCPNLTSEQYNSLSTQGKEYYQLLQRVKEEPNIIFEDIYDSFEGFGKIIPAGSVMATLGLNKLSSLSNCFVIDSPKDSISGIMNQLNSQAQLMKYRGGVGHDISTIRPRGTEVENSAKFSTGAASFMDLFSHVTNTIAQDGRRGALMLSMHIKHPDILEFAEMKQDLTKVTGANVSIQVTNDFMDKVIKDEDFILTYPIDFELSKNVDISKLEYNKLIPVNSISKDQHYGYIKRVKAKEIWDTIIKCAHNSAEPGVLFIDAIHNYSPDGVYKQFKAISTNPCQPGWATVLTPNGISTFNQVNEGDFIWSKDGWTKIIRKECSGVKDVYEYRTSSGIFYGTAQHRVISKGIKIEVDNAETIDALAGGYEDTYPIDPIDVMDGLVIGDGSVHKASNNLVYLCIGEHDTDYFTSEIKPLLKEHRSGLKPTAWTVETTIEAFQLPKTYDRTIPNKFYYGSPTVMRGFLRGLFSANGSVVDNRVTLKTSSPLIRDRVQVMLSALGIRSYYTTNKTKDVEFKNGTYSCKESYDINISYDRYIFYSRIGFIQQYKMDKLKNTLTSKLASPDKTYPVISKTHISTENVYNITVDNMSHTYWTGGLNVSNCGEIPLGPFDSCRLIHQNLTDCVRNPFSDDSHVDRDVLYNNSYHTLVLGDSLVDLEIEAIDKIIEKVSAGNDPSEIDLWHKIRKNGLEGRRIGCGFTGLADVFAMLGITYDSPEALDCTESMMHTIFEAHLDATIDLAILRGVFPAQDLDKEFDSDMGKNEFYTFLQDTYPEQYKKMYVDRIGRRNLSWSTLAPTGTTSLMTQTSSGIEPVFLPYYMRRRKCSSPEDRVDYVDKNGEKYMEFFVLHPMFKQWLQIYEPQIIDNTGNIINTVTEKELKVVFENSPWFKSTANDINWEKRIVLQGIIQKYTTHAISSTLNLPKETTPSVVHEIYFKALQENLKGVTIYRDGSRDGILNSIDSSNKSNRQAEKRPKVLEADYYQIKSKGIQYIVLVGLLHDKPYEIFTFKPLHDVDIKSHKGVITKIKKGHYSYDSDYIHIDNLELANTNIEEKASSLYTSMLLRHHADINFIIKTAKKVDDNIGSFSSAMCRVLSKYIGVQEVEGEKCPQCGGTRLIRESGCIKCLDCDYSKCL